MVTLQGDRFEHSIGIEVALSLSQRGNIVLKRILSLVVLVFLLAPDVWSAEKNVPFVPAWDRFGQHQEIPDSLSSTVLISELSCVACHASGNPIYQAKAGPQLQDAGTRLNQNWIQKYLMDPAEQRHGTTMPDVLADLTSAEKAQAAKALAAFLASQQKPLFEIKGTGINPVPLEFWKHGDSERGREIYHTTGCVACHEADEGYDVSEMKLSDSDRQLEQLDPEDIAELGLEAAARRVNSIPHPQLHRKYTLKSLTWFLTKPEAVRPSGRMPNPGLRAVDAADVAKWLIEKSSRTDGKDVAEQQPVNSDPVDPVLVQQGAVLFQRRGCVNCHAMPSIPVAASASLEAVAASLKANPGRSSCLSNPTGRMPRYHLDQNQARSISSGLQSLNTRLETKQALQLTMLQLNCYACHERQQQGGVGRYRKAYFETVGQIDIGDEGRLPPPLTGVGARLKTAWMKNVFRGKAALRPFMTIRMPLYPDSTVSKLPGQFQKVDHPQPFPSEQQVFGQVDGLADAGRQLMDAGCVQCHVFNGESLPGTVGVNLTNVADRVNADWLHAFLLNPGAVKRGTRMPTFFPGGKSQNSTILNGDTSKQISAIYAYLKEIDKQPLPQKIADVRNQDFELRPTDAPIVFRTFMPVAGTHAIAVGYPENVHVAFDAENLFWAEAWRGRFLDAQGTWYVRAAPPAVPLGDERIQLPPGPVVASLSQVTQAWPAKVDLTRDRFDGYSLKAGIPVLKYHVAGVKVFDRFDPAENGALVRTLTFTPEDGESETPHMVWLKAHEASSLKRVAAGEFQAPSGLTVRVQGLNLSDGQMVRQGTSMRWLLPVPLTVQQPTTVKIQYQW